MSVYLHKYNNILFTLFPECWVLMELCTPICGAPCVNVSASTVPVMLAPATPGVPPPPIGAPCINWPWYCILGATLPRPVGPIIPFIICPCCDMFWPMSPWLCPLFSTVWLKPVLILMPGLLQLPGPLDAPMGFWGWDEWLGEAWPRGLLHSVLNCPPMPGCPPLPDWRSCESCLCLVAASGMMAPILSATPPSPLVDMDVKTASPFGISSSGRSFSKSNKDPKSKMIKEGNN